MTDGAPMVRLVLHHADSVLLLQRALENYHGFNHSQACHCLAQKPPATKRAAVYAARRDLLQQLLDQLPESAPLLAPLGDK